MGDRVRLFTEEDIPDAMRLKASANWNQTVEDWVRFRNFEPHGCFCVEADGRLVSTAGAIRYGTRLGWIGMVLTLPEYQGRGFARRLMEAAIEFLEASGVEWIKLDATAQGRPIYAKLGFEDECPIERWYRPANPVPPVPLDAFRPDSDLDRIAFGADRAVVLAELARIESASVPGHGYAMARSGSEAFYFGPCVSRSAGAARKLVEWGLGRVGNRPLYWDILPANHDAVALAREFGFERRRELVRMARRGAGKAPPVDADTSLTYGIAGFEYG